MRHMADYRYEPDVTSVETGADCTVGIELRAAMKFWIMPRKA
ncbi:hypothetical protein [Enterocloster bolteae]|nr:hypothetical protein [Enterocloster bolteae]